jgi:archaellum biogenesis ATPase FlaH
MKKDNIKVQMSLEAALLKALSSKANYERFIHIIDMKRLNPITALLLKDYKKYYDKYKEDVNFETFYPSFCDWHKRDLDDRDLKQYRETVFPAIIEANPMPSLFVSLLEKEASQKIEDSVSNGINSEDILNIIHDLGEKRKQYLPEGEDEETFTLVSVDVSKLDVTNGIEWALSSLQAGLNSIMPGQFIVVAADSNTGKSAFCITQAVHTFKHLHKIKSKRPILYCTSEDTKEDLACRFLSCLYKDKMLGGFEEIIKQYSKVSESFKKHYDEKLFIGMQIRSPSDLHRIKEKILKYNPSLIIIDMLDKLSNSDQIQDLTKLYQEIRSIANDGIPVIGTSQTGNTSWQDKETGQFKSRKFLSDKDLSGSKSGKQGAAYCIISIGKDDDMPDIRYISTTKKKRGQNVQTTCTLENIYSCYKEVF